MTSAARPTWNAAVGGNTLRDRGGATTLVRAKDLNSQTKLKYRQPGQSAPEDLKEKDLLDDLEARESGEIKKKRLGEAQEPKRKRLRMQECDEEPVERQDDAPSTTGSKSSDSSSDSNSDSSSDSDSNVDSEDEDEALLRELEKIKRERAEERERKEMEERERIAKEREEEVLGGNPLLDFGAKPDFSVKRRWDDDVVFKNQAKGVEDIPKKGFINDMLRSSFHKKFMDKYVR